ncbi:Rtr1/RPAP2 family-domain-containing protein [Aspergillus bertholletiae]|uniref:RNA polymerase II subunit B1 CTD phosphatase RPAP2 homolog n=1 Tax=Aspergillus bertholletiae TaxID=1226010 RepID=A0A5N7BG30_9EURO|nr:Rtr1/RPAP2 family-domain-containing protein [Aspergillus bertholletiae]
MSTGRPNLKTSLPSAHAASTQAPLSMRRAPPKSNMSRQQQGPPANKPNSDPRHLAIALHHAHRIQAQKDTESLILDRILELVTFPSSPSADPASPSPEDALAFKSALIPFQPADYDNLIQERNIEGLCGYGLCPHEHRKDDSRGTYRITWGAKGSGPGGRGRDMNIVPREKLEMWCSDECAERALYIRVQLAEEPVWERRADDSRGKTLLLLEEGRAATRGGNGKAKSSATVREVTGQLDNLHMSRTPGSSNLIGDMSKLSVGSGAHFHELALERGDTNPALRAGRVDVQIQEKDNLAYEHVTAPEMRPGDDKGGSIEGYVPQEF